MEMSKYKQVLDELYSTIEAKNHDYGDSFEHTIDEFGVVAVAIRLNDKVERFKTLAKGGNAKVNESIMDTLRDIAGYSTLALACLDVRKSEKSYVGKRLEDPVCRVVDDYYNSILTQLPAAMAFDLSNIVSKEVDAGGVMIEAVGKHCNTFNEHDKEIHISFAKGETYPEPIFSIVAVYRWNQQSGKYRYVIKRRTKNGDNVLAEGGPI